MIRILYIFFALLTISGCSQKFESIELNNNFTEEEISDLHKLNEFFQTQMCGSASNFKSCIYSNLPDLLEYGYDAILENVDFDKQQKLYSDFQSDLFLQIWDFCQSGNFHEKVTYKSLCLNTDGKYLQFLKDLSDRNPDLKEYYDRMFDSGDWEPTGLLQGRIYTNPGYYDLDDPSIQVLIAVQFLTQNDQQKRKEIWTDTTQ
ncbi:hypothetical protein KZP23_08080 [Echinicola marina]|uniref:hypothetical protein n=1 Tax=Echinicola marina TaxID=2859768 RepID=UPI001CF65356|nr:hypothetical protein [Echinicola marina]UCS94957.1 hypothetical protein KZP23_08080 [Echinicola marina]